MDLAFLGSSAISLAFFLAVYGAVASVWGARAKRDDLIRSGRRAAFAVWLLVLFAVGCLEWHLIRRDYSLEYVAEEVDNSMPLYWRVVALWGGMNGSLLWWSLICSTYTAACLWINRNRFRELMPWVTATCLYVLSFLTLLVGGLSPLLRLAGRVTGKDFTAWECNPFLPLSASDPGKGLIDLVASQHDGKGLNPLLQTYWMSIHPPSLYTGYIGFTIPFAFCIAALVTGRVADGEFLRATRRWTLFAWMVLGFGIMLGAKWAYEVLGWGGYWGWDPVENASLMPWIVATAYVHSVIIQEKRGMLRGWNVFLILLTFLMTYFGTFLTRSGVVQSVHAFGSGPIAWVLGGFILSLVVLCVTLFVTRIDELKADTEIESVFSREATFLYNNVGLLGFMVMVLVGTMFPVVSEAVKGNKIVVGPPFFNPLAGLLTLGLLILMGIGQLVAWRKTSDSALKRNFAPPLWATGAFAIVLFTALFVAGYTVPVHLLLLGTHDLPEPWAVAFFTGCFFVLSGIVWEYAQGTRAMLASQRGRIAAMFEAGEGVPAGFLIGVGIAFSVLGWAFAGVVMYSQGWFLRLLFGAACGLAAIGTASLLGGRKSAYDAFAAMAMLFGRNRRRYGGYVVHLGIVLVIAGIVASSLSVFKVDETHTFQLGEKKSIGGYDVTYTGLDLQRIDQPGMWQITAFLTLEKNGKAIGVARPAKRLYDKGDQPTTEVSISENALRDYYTILEDYTDPRLGKRFTTKTATIRFLVRPLVEWFWFGALIMVFGTGVAAWPARKRQPALSPSTEPAPAPSGTGPAPAMARSRTEL